MVLELYLENLIHQVAKEGTRRVVVLYKNGQKSGGHGLVDIIS